MAALCTCQLICNTESSVHCLQVAEMLQQDIASRLLMTYRKDFPPIGGALLAGQWMLMIMRPAMKCSRENALGTALPVVWLANAAPRHTRGFRQRSELHLFQGGRQNLPGVPVASAVELHHQLDHQFWIRASLAWQDVRSTAGHGLLSQPAP